MFVDCVARLRRPQRHRRRSRAPDARLGPRRRPAATASSGMRERAPDVRRHPRGGPRRRRVRGPRAPAAHRTMAETRAMTDPIRIVLVDDEAMVRVGLRMVLSGEPDLEVVGEASDGAEAVDVVLEHEARRRAHGRADAPGRRHRGATPCAGRRRRTSRVVVLTTFDEDEYVEAALRSGRQRLPAQGGSARAADRRRPHGRRRRRSARPRSDRAGDRVVRVVPRRLRTRRAEVLDTLTERERDVLTPDRPRACRTRRSRRSSTWARPRSRPTSSSLLAKLGLRDRVQAVVAAYETGHVRPGE